MTSSAKPKPLDQSARIAVGVCRGPSEADQSGRNTSDLNAETRDILNRSAAVEILSHDRVRHENVRGWR